MIVDPSAIAAVMFEEPDAAAHRALLLTQGGRMSAASYVELAAVVDGRGSRLLSERLDDVLDELGVTLTEFTGAQAHEARAAYRRFGRGSGHPARLNFGDCISYATAKTTGEPLLYKGNEFALTDIEAAVGNR